MILDLGCTLVNYDMIRIPSSQSNLRIILINITNLSAIVLINTAVNTGVPSPC